MLGLVGSTNLMPGRNATEMLMHLGCTRPGGLNLMHGGATLLMPAVVNTAWVVLGAALAGYALTRLGLL